MDTGFRRHDKPGRPRSLMSGSRLSLLPGPVHIGGEPDAVARGHHDVALDDHRGDDRRTRALAHDCPPLPSLAPMQHFR